MVFKFDADEGISFPHMLCMYRHDQLVSLDGICTMHISDYVNLACMSLCHRVLVIMFIDQYEDWA